MSGPDTLPPDEIELRAQPRPVARINRRTLIIAAALVCGGLFAVALIALDPPSFQDEAGPREVFRVDNTARPDGLEALPRRYSEVPTRSVAAIEPASIPELGPPLPGDLGGTIVDAERDLGIGPPLGEGRSFRPDPESDAQRAERIRQARLAQQGREAGVFFTLSSSPSGQSEGVGLADPFAGLAAMMPSGVPTGAPGGAAVLHDVASPYAVLAGTIIPASLITGVNSDLPGLVIAQVTEPVYDTVTGRYLLIPQGSRLIGRYESEIAFAQSRALIVWTRLIRPDGASIRLDDPPAVDLSGYAGLEDQVDFHTWRLIRGVTLSTLLGIGTELGTEDEEGELAQAIRDSAQGALSDAGQEITRRNLDIQPTLTIRPGWPLRVIVHEDLILRPYGGAP